MSYGVQGTGAFGSTSQTDTTASNSLRPFANLDLTEDQRKQIRSIFKNAQSQGLSQAEVEQQISAILSPTQQSTFQNDLAAQSTASATASGSTQATPSGSPPPPGGGSPFADPNGPFANLDLSSTQQAQVATILQNAESQGLSFSQVNAQISAVLTSSQQATFASDLQNLPQPPGSTSSSDPLANLDLTSGQQSQISQIFANAQTNGTSQSDVLSQIEAVLTPAQQLAFLQDVQTAQAIVSGQSQNGSGETTAASTNPSGSTATLSNGLTEQDVQNQIAAATSLLLQQFQQEFGIAS